MKLPLGSTVVGLLLGIAAVVQIAPRTTEGAAFLMLTIVLLVAAIGLLAGRLWSIADRSMRRRSVPGDRPGRPPRS